MFVNATLDEVAATADRCSLTLLQLHGDEGPAYCREAARRTGAQVMKAVRVARRRAARATCALPHRLPPARRLLAAHAGRHRRDVRLGARPAAPRRTPPVVLSGGLDPDNVGRGDRGRAPVRGRHRERHRGGARAQGPGQADGVLRARSRRPTRAARRSHERAAASSGASAPTAAATCPETLIPALDELEREWLAARADPAFADRARAAAARLRRPADAALPGAARISEAVGGEVWLKREDLTHTGSHKINNALGQALLAQRMGKPRVIAETGAGQHGVATRHRVRPARASSASVYMGTEDMRRQRPNVERMRLLGAEVVGVEAGARTLKEAVSRGDPRLGRERRDDPLRDRLGRRARRPTRRWCATSSA